MSAIASPQLAVLDPATGEPIGHIPAGAAPEAHDAVRSARAAHGAWARTDPGARGSLLKAAARRLRECARELAELQTRETGAPLAGSLGGVEAGIASLEAYAELGPLERGRPPRGDLVLREPRGVVAILMPWCDPLAATCGALAAALVAGNAVVLKPSQKAPLAAERLAELLDLGDDPADPPRRRARRAPARDAPGRRSRDAPGRGGRGQPPGDHRRRRRSRVGGGRGGARARSRARASPAARSSASTCTAWSPSRSSTR